MSMLVGVRGQSRENEGATLREGIIQQPGPFYNGNPSSIIWGNSPTTPLWREETVSPFSSTTTSSGFGISKQRQQQQHVQTEEKEKDHSSAGMVTGEGRASSKGRRHVTRAQLGRHMNPNPNPSATSSPFAFGFPPQQQPPPGSSSSSTVPGFGQSRMPSPAAVASSGSFGAFGSGNNFTPGAFAAGLGADVSTFRAGVALSPQDERMEDIEEVNTAMAEMTMKDYPTRDSKFSTAKVDELTTRSGVAAQDESPSWAPTESEVAAKFRNLGFNRNASTAEQSMDRKDAAGAGVFVFGAKPAAASETEAEGPEGPAIVQVAPPAARSRPVKGKRNAPAVKGKGIAVAGDSEELSAELALKLGLGGSHSSGTPFSNAEPATGSFLKDVLAAPILFSRDAKTGGANQDADGLQSSTSSPTKTAESLRAARESASVEAEETPHFRSFVQVQPSEPTIPNVQREPFVFGASRSQPQPTSAGLDAAAASPSPLFKFGATATPSSAAPSSSTTAGGDLSRNASTSAADLLAFKDKGSSSATANSRSPPQAEMDSFSSFNLGAAKNPVKADEASNKSEDILPGMKQSMPTTAPNPSVASGANTKEDSDDNSSYVTAGSRFVFSAGSGSPTPVSPAPKGTGTVPGAEQRVKEEVFPAGSNATSDFFDAQSWCQPLRGIRKSFEFQASSGSNTNSTKKKSNRTRASVPRRHSRSSATSREDKNSDSFANLVDMSGTAEEAGSPMDFSPQRYTPPNDTMHEMGQTAKHAAWDHSHSMDKDGLDGDDEWTQYSETDVAIENLRNAANDLTINSEQGGRATWEGIGNGEEESFWWGGKPKSAGKTAGRAGKWKRAVFDENQIPASAKDNTWADIKVGATKEPESAASSSTRSADSSVSSGSWGPFTFTAGTSPNFSSTTSFLRRHARKIQRDRPFPGSTDGAKKASFRVQAEATPSGQAGVNAGFGGNSSAAAGGSSTMPRPVFSFESRGNPPADAGKGINGRVPNWDQLKAPGVMFPSRSNSWSTESSMGSLSRPDGVGAPINPQTTGAAATEQVCERWRLRGNQAYANGDFPKAEEYYSRGASSVPPNETSQSCIRASMLCYSNRAATRMVVGRMREALADCMRAMAVDPNFLRVRLRAASCHLALGETEPAALAYKECIRRAKEDEQPDLKVSSEASEGLRKALQVDEYLDRAYEILANWSSGDTPTALRLLNETLLSSPHSERALELKARALLSLRRYEEVVQLCEQSLVTAERNHPQANGDSSIYQLLQAAGGVDSTKSGAMSPIKMWRWQLSAKAKFHLGRLEEALEMLQKRDEMATVGADKASSAGTSPGSEPWALSIGIIRDLLRHKAAGNDAFQNGKHAEAVEHYSAALACNGDSRPFNAVCFCNRAAASQALGHIADAIADCSRAVALDPKYAKAISRRATLHESVRDYGQSCHDLQRLITHLEGQQQQSRATVSPSRAGRSTTHTQQDLRQTRERFSKAEDEMKKGHPLDHYMILGLEPGCSSNEIKKAYRKAALRHHPDKAGQFLARGEGGDDGGMWKEVADEVRRDAERLFKLIGEANAILSDPQKRTKYDAEEEFRKLRTRTGTPTGSFSDIYRSAERTGQGGGSRRPRDRYDTWNGYTHQHQRWQSGPDAAQPDTYARRGRYGSNNSSRSNGDGDRWTDYDWDDI